MMRSLYAGVSGLRTHQTKMDIIGNNIANVNTVAYKSSSMTFGELMYQTTQSASGPNALTGTGGVNAKQIGLGVQAGAISTSITTAGASQTTGNPFDIKINGDSFFVVSDGASNYFTRAGSFYVDAAGNLAMTSNGYNVMGWGVDETGTAIKKDSVTALRIMSDENMTYPPEATTKAYVSGIVDKNDTDVNSENGKIMNMKFYDKLGYSYTGKLAMKALGNGEYAVEIVDVLDSTNKSVMDQFSGLTLGSDEIWTDEAKTLKVSNNFSNGSITYTDSTGAEKTVSVGGIKDLTGADRTAAEEALAKAFGYEGKLSSFRDQYVEVTINGTPTKRTLGSLIDDGSIASAIDTSASPATISSLGRKIVGTKVTYDESTGKFAGINGLSTKTSTTLNLSSGGGNFTDIEVDFKTSSMYDNNGTSTISAKNGDTDGVGTGRKLGELAGVSIQNNGMIYASYDNGMTRLLGQIAVAEFANPSGLEKMGDNLYQATMNSGEFDGIGTDISANGGSMNTGVLEMSNVDLSQEFAEMITTQRGFQANSRIITVSDTLLEELVNLKR